MQMYCVRIMSFHIKWVHATSSQGCWCTNRYQWHVYNVPNVCKNSHTDLHLNIMHIPKCCGVFLEFLIFFYKLYSHNHTRSPDSIIWFEHCAPKCIWIIECPEKKPVRISSWRQTRLGLNYWGDLFLSVETYQGCAHHAATLCVSVF